MSGTQSSEGEAALCKGHRTEVLKVARGWFPIFCEQCRGVAEKAEDVGAGRVGGHSAVLNDMDVDMEELSFIPSAVSSSAGWHEPQFMCVRQCWKSGFQYFEIASVTVEDDGELHMMNI